MLCAISYNLYNLKNVKNTQGRLLLLVELKVTLLHVCFLRFLKSWKWYQIGQSVSIKNNKDSSSDLVLIAGDLNSSSRICIIK